MWGQPVAFVTSVFSMDASQALVQPLGGCWLSAPRKGETTQPLLKKRLPGHSTCHVGSRSTGQCSLGRKLTRGGWTLYPQGGTASHAQAAAMSPDFPGATFSSSRALLAQLCEGPSPWMWEGRAHLGRGCAGWPQCGSTMSGAGSRRHSWGGITGQGTLRIRRQGWRVSPRRDPPRCRGPTSTNTLPVHELVASKKRRGRNRPRLSGFPASCGANTQMPFCVCWGGPGSPSGSPRASELGKRSGEERTAKVFVL